MSYPNTSVSAMLKTKVAGFDLDCCIYNASGPRTGTVEALEKVGSSKSGVILSKSATLVAQDGNQLPRFINKIELGPGICDGSMNSEGLPNGGIDYCKNNSLTISLIGYRNFCALAAYISEYSNNYFMCEMINSHLLQTYYLDSYWWSN